MTPAPASAPTPHVPLIPPGWAKPVGYSNGVAARGTFVFVGGQIGWDSRQVLAETFVGQVEQALANIVAVLAEGGARPEHLVRLTWYVTDLQAYGAALKEIGAVYRRTIGPVYPPMSVVQVCGLVEADARVEIEATAVVPS